MEDNSPKVYKLIEPPKRKYPLLISIPHSGTSFPPEIKEQFHSHFLENPEDTDWLLEELYDFASELGIPVLKANYSRYVVDLNRSSTDVPLYQDGRFTTGLVPTHSFAKEPLYKQGEPNQEEIFRRTKQYWLPYHQEIQNQIQSIKNQWGKCLLFDAHSIGRHVPSISPTAFPDLIIGDCKGKSCDQRLTEEAQYSLSEGTLEVSVNHPFKGGFITREYGKPEQNVHALQLEMSQDVYMDSEKNLYTTDAHKKIKTMLKTLIHRLAMKMENLEE